MRMAHMFECLILICGTIWEGFESVALLEEMCHGVGFEASKSPTIPSALSLSLPSTYRWALRLLGIPVAVVLLHHHDLQPSET